MRLLAIMCLAAAVCALSPQAAAAADDAVPAYDNIEQLIEDGNYARAEDILDDRILSNEKDVVALSLLSKIYRANGNRKRAIEVLQKAIRFEPAYPEPYALLADIYLSMQKTDEAVRHLALFKERMKPFVGTDPALTAYYTATLRRISSELLINKQYDRFRAEVDEILRIAPKDQESYFNLGVYYYRYRLDRQAAYQAFDKAAKIEPGSPIAKKAAFAIEFIRANPDPRIAPDYSFVDQEFK